MNANSIIRYLNLAALGWAGEKFPRGRRGERAGRGARVIRRPGAEAVLIAAFPSNARDGSTACLAPATSFLFETALGETRDRFDVISGMIQFDSNCVRRLKLNLSLWGVLRTFISINPAGLNFCVAIKEKRVDL